MIKTYQMPNGGPSTIIVTHQAGIEWTCVLTKQALSSQPVLFGKASLEADIIWQALASPENFAANSQEARLSLLNRLALLYDELLDDYAQAASDADWAMGPGDGYSYAQSLVTFRAQFSELYHALRESLCLPPLP